MIGDSFFITLQIFEARSALSKAIFLFKRLNSHINDFIYNSINNEIEFNELGVCKLKLRKFKKLPTVMQIRLLNYLLKIIGGKKYPRKR